VNWRLEIARDATKELARLPAHMPARVAKAILALEQNPFPRGGKKLKNRDGWRIRVGDYRVLNFVASRGPLPFTKTVEDAVALAEKERGNFYVTAFMIEAWLGEITMRACDEYAKTKEASERRMQTGEAHRLFQVGIGDAADGEFPPIVSCLVRFIEYDDPQAETLARAWWALGAEHEVEGHPLEAIGGKSPAEMMTLARDLLSDYRHPSPFRGVPPVFKRLRTRKGPSPPIAPTFLACARKDATCWPSAARFARSPCDSAATSAGCGW